VTPTLVAIDLPGGPSFVEQLEQIWRDGNAAFPVDQRLPAAAKREVCLAVRVGDAVEPGDALVVATSGSTGVPKGVVLTHDAVAASAAATSARIGVTPDDHWLACLPLSHVGGLSVVTRALHCDTGLTVIPAFDAAAVDASPATLVSLVGTALARIDPSGFRAIVLGGSRPPADRPPNTITTYGLTETGSGVVYDGVPLDGVDVDIAGDGEIRLRGPMLLRAYRDGAIPLDPSGWLATGDLGEWDERGRLQIAGRRSDLIITGGENVWPEAVESVLSTHPEVADVLVEGRNDDEWGQIVVAVVVATAGTRPTLEALRDHVKATQPAYMAPKALILVETLPRTSIGKLRRGQPPDPATPAPPSIT
jgi:O-succinylbenzoic acid--CoA ligase